MSIPPNKKCTHRHFISKITLMDIVEDKHGHSTKDSYCKTLKELQEKPPTIVDIRATATVEETLQSFKRCKINAVPVFQMLQNQEKYYIDVITMADLIHWMYEEKPADISKCNLVDIIGAKKPSETNVWIHPSFHHIDIIIQPFLKKQKMFLTQIFDPTKFSKLAIAVVTQFDVFDFLHRNASKLSRDFLSIRLKETKYGSGSHLDKSLTVRSSDTASQCFHTMKFYHYESLVVLGDDKKIMANLSASDLTNLKMEELTNLENINVIDFLNQISSTGQMRKIVSLQPEDTLEKAMALFGQQKVRQIWISDRQGHLLNQLSLAEMIELICSFPFDVSRTELLI